MHTPDRPAVAPVLASVDDGIARLTLNRPDKLNALNYATIDALMARLDAIETDPAVRAVVLTGAGDRAFSAGGDIREFSGSVARGVAAATQEFVRRGQAMTARIEAFPKPIIVAVNGLAFGGGCEITEAAHLAIASERALFAKPALLLTGERFSPAQALEMGLVNAVVPHDELIPAASDLARRIVRHAPLAVSAVITAVTRGLNMGIAEGLQVESEQFARMVPTADLAEGLAAWIDGREPLYQGR